MADELKCGELTSFKVPVAAKGLDGDPAKAVLAAAKKFAGLPDIKEFHKEHPCPKKGKCKWYVVYTPITPPDVKPSFTYDPTTKKYEFTLTTACDYSKKCLESKDLRDAFVNQLSKTVYRVVDSNKSI